MRELDKACVNNTLNKPAGMRSSYMGDYRNLVVWRRSYAFALTIYRCTAEFPADERFGMVSQLRRAATSIAVNIAEGSGRGSDAEQRRFLRMALGSARECSVELLLARDLKYVGPNAGNALLTECDKIAAMPQAWIKKLSVKF